MEIKIGVQNVGREIVLESTQDAETVAKVVGEAINEGSELRLKDDKGRLIIVPRRFRPVLVAACCRPAVLQGDPCFR